MLHHRTWKMKTKILIIAILITLVGCRSSKLNIEKTLASAEVEKIVQVEKHVEEKKVKDSIKVVEKKDEKKETETNLHVEFDPKKNDSLEVNHFADGDSLKLKINGNGIVIFDYKKRKQEAKNFVKEIFGSVTLKNIDSTVTEKRKENSVIKTEVKTKEVKSNSFTFGAYLNWIIIAGRVIAAVFFFCYRDWETDRKSTRLNSSHSGESRMPSSA